MKKAISLITSFLCALSCLTMAGCGKKKTTEVYFLNFKPESATVYEELAKKYDTELLKAGVKKENIRHYGFAFEGKKVLIGTDE